MSNNNVIDLDDVLLTVTAVNQWHAFAGQVAAGIRALGITDPEQIPIEQGRVNPDGTLTIFVTLPQGEVSMVVPREHWAYRSRH